MRALTGGTAAGVRKTLSRFSAGNLKTLEEEDVRVVVVDPERTPEGGYLGRPQWYTDAQGNEAGGFYRTGSKTILVALDSIGTLPHEIGHALDDAAIQDDSQLRCLSHDDPDFQELFQAYETRITQGEQHLWSDYASCASHEYFAEGVAFLKGSQEQRDILSTRDPELFHYLRRTIEGL